MKVSLSTGHPALISLRMNPIENRNLTNPEEIEKALRLGNYIKKGAWFSAQSYFIVIHSVIFRDTRTVLVKEISSLEENVSRPRTSPSRTPVVCPKS